MGEYVFDAAAVRDRLVVMIREHAAKNGFDKVVLGISGGKDSTVAAALCARALGADHVYGVMMPDREQADIADSIQVCKSLGIRNYTMNIGPMHAALLEAAKEIPFSEESNVNVGPRLRMTTLRYVAQAVGARLCGTGNLSEATVGYCTKDGDTSCDFNPLGALTSVEVVQVGLTIDELPKELVEKTPTDGLSGKSDEEKLGLKYADIHKYIRFGTCGDAAVDEKIRRKEAANMHKRMRPPVLDPLGEKE
ncbi:MAG: NAD(+) synthase [Lachnospiraceae bacterium]|nr:NAD(+) synthase [Lachnospiraceae bacterium]